MPGHEEARIIEPTVNESAYYLIHIATNTTDQPDI
jgi:hypothetical protein